MASATGASLAHNKSVVVALASHRPSAPLTMAAPRTCPKCHALVGEDAIFAAQLAMVGLRRRRFACVAGHSTYLPRPLVIPAA